MREWIQIALLAAIAIEGAILAVDRISMPRWSYRIVAPSDAELRQDLETAGNNGWEIVAARRAVTKEVPAYELILKRPGGTSDGLSIFFDPPRPTLDPK